MAFFFAIRWKSKKDFEQVLSYLNQLAEERYWLHETWSWKIFANLACESNRMYFTSLLVGLHWSSDSANWTFFVCALTRVPQRHFFVLARRVLQRMTLLIVTSSHAGHSWSLVGGGRSLAQACTIFVLLSSSPRSEESK